MELGPLTRNATRPDIQGLRAVAVLLVVGFHADLGARAGHLGVDAFLVISGFVITRSLQARSSSTVRDLRDFFRRRVTRLLPSLLALVAVTVTLLPLLGPVGTRQVAARTGFAASTLHANVFLERLTTDYFAPASDLNPLLHRGRCRSRNSSTCCSVCFWSFWSGAPAGVWVRAC